VTHALGSSARLFTTHHPLMHQEVQHISEIVKNECHLVEGVWQIADAQPFAYSDGEATEEYVLNVIRNSTDISSSSRELESKIVDWPTRYHLSRERSLAYWGMLFKPGMRILEVGSGCGSISRFLGETGCSVLCLEASLRRARITRERTRDLPNVSVLSAPFQKVEYKQAFDVLICNGVFEYSAAFVEAADPYESILKNFRQALAPDGALVMAIENQFGLRYFTSSREDHNGVMFDGVEGYPRYPNGARTFGDHALEALILKDFAAVEWLIPLSDYKLPTAIVRDSFSRKHDVSELLVSMPISEHDAMVKPLFHEKLAWHDIARNGLTRTFANSLIAIAHGGECKLLDPKWQGSAYSLGRQPWFSTKTSFVSADDGISVEVRKEHWENTSTPPTSATLVHDCPTTQLWIDGTSVRSLMARLFCQRSATPLATRIAPLVRAWWDAVIEGANSENLADHQLDALWNNAIHSGSSVTLIDTEWRWAGGVARKWLLYRAVHQFVAAELPYVHRWAADARRLSEWELLGLVATICGEKLTREDLSFVTKADAEFHRQVSGYQSTKMKSFWLNARVKSMNIENQQRAEKLKTQLGASFGRLMRRLSRA
jgi:2-polyprenyl-3-methyl-5-hydroxy-6-metoxy-1,4-benzoquinol methylase